MVEPTTIVPVLSRRTSIEAEMAVGMRDSRVAAARIPAAGKSRVAEPSRVVSNRVRARPAARLGGRVHQGRVPPAVRRA